MNNKFSFIKMKNYVAINQKAKKNICKGKKLKKNYVCRIYNVSVKSIIEKQAEDLNRHFIEGLKRSVNTKGCLARY